MLCILTSEQELGGSLACRLLVEIIFLALKKVFPFVFHQKRKKRESAKNSKKNIHKKGVDQRLSAIKASDTYTLVDS